MNAPTPKFVGDYTDYVTVTVHPTDLTVPPSQETIRYDQFVTWLFKADTEPMMALHAALGVCGEVGELIEADMDFKASNVIEEAGDLEFYLQAVRNHYKIVRNFVQDFGQHLSSSPNVQQRLAIEAGNLADVIKREYIYGKPRDTQAVRDVLMRIENLMPYYYPVPRIQILQANANKLSKRYSDLRYSDASAIQRADKAAPDNPN